MANQLLPWALQHVELGPRTLEIGPGYGATLQALLGLTASLTAVEVDNSMVERLNRRYGQRARIIRGDGTQTGLPDDHFTSVVCFTMLHHVASAQLQDQLFAEAYRVLQPGGVFAGSDGVPSLPFRQYTSPTPTLRSPRRTSPVGCELWDSLISTSMSRALA
ncbi:methyltransferase [Mycobacterium tuberculosis]|nr:methyltransferase [Mycobacterium tuberculosis]